MTGSSILANAQNKSKWGFWCRSGRVRGVWSRHSQRRGGRRGEVRSVLLFVLLDFLIYLGGEEREQAPTVVVASR